jgi:hypothetical protein
MITPGDSPAAPSQYAAVPVSGADIQAPQDDLSGLVADSVSVTTPRQSQTEALLTSPQGFGLDGYDIDAGFSGGGGDDWPNDAGHARAL